MLPGLKRGAQTHVSVKGNSGKHTTADEGSSSAKYAVAAPASAEDEGEAAAEERRPRTSKESLMPSFNTFVWDGGGRTKEQKSAGLSLGDLAAKAQLRKFDKLVRRQNLQMLLLALFGIVLMMARRLVDADADADDNEGGDGDDGGKGSLWDQPLAIASSASTTLLLVLLCSYYRTQEQLAHRLRRFPPLLSVTPRRNFLIEFAVLAWHRPPGWDIGDAELLMFLRLYLLLRVLRDFNGMYVNRIELLRSSQALQLSRFDWYLALKNFFFFYPLPIVLASTLVVTLILAYCIEVVEDDEQALGFGQSMWLVLMSMTTVGFGDVVPLTPAGRTLSFVAAMAGLMLTAIVISVIHSQLALSHGQAYSLKLIERNQLLVKEVAAAKAFIVSYWRYRCRSNRRLRAAASGSQCGDSATTVGAGGAGGTGSNNGAGTAARRQMSPEEGGSPPPSPPGAPSGGEAGTGACGAASTDASIGSSQSPSRLRRPEPPSPLRSIGRSNTRAWGEAAVPVEDQVQFAAAMDLKRKFKLARAKRMQCELSVSDPATHVLMAVQSTVKVIEASLLDQVNLTINLKSVLPRDFPADELDEYKRVAGEEMGQLCERITAVEERLRSLDLLARQLTVRVKRGTLASPSPSPDVVPARRAKSCSFAAAPVVQASDDDDDEAHGAEPGAAS